MKTKNPTFLFRGKRKDNGEWVYGSYLKITNGNNLFKAGDFIVTKNSEVYDVVKETVTQYVGKDKKGQKVFVGDIVIDNMVGGVECVVKFDNIDKRFLKVKHRGIMPVASSIWNKWSIEVIGNIFGDNKNTFR